MSRFYSPPDTVKKDYIYIKKDEAHHVYKVMRLRTQDKVIVFDGASCEYEGIIIKATPKLVVVKIKKTKDVISKPELQVSIAVGLPKAKKMDLIIQKCTELNVKEIIPMTTERSMIFLDENKKKKKILRWQEIAKEASKQCGRIKIPEINNLKSFEKILEESKNYDFVIMPCLNENAISLAEFFKNKKPTKEHKILILIGPEGGFTLDEISRASKDGFLLTSLGQSTLRTETACIYVMSVINFCLED